MVNGEGSPRSGRRPRLRRRRPRGPGATRLRGQRRRDIATALGERAQIGGGSAGSTNTLDVNRPPRAPKSISGISSSTSTSVSRRANVPDSPVTCGKKMAAISEQARAGHRGAGRTGRDSGCPACPGSRMRAGRRPALPPESADRRSPRRPPAASDGNRSSVPRRSATMVGTPMADGRPSVAGTTMPSFETCRADRARSAWISRLVLPAPFGPVMTMPRWR